MHMTKVTEPALSCPSHLNAQPYNFCCDYAFQRGNRIPHRLWAAIRWYGPGGGNVFCCSQPRQCSWKPYGRCPDMCILCIDLRWNCLRCHLRQPQIKGTSRRAAGCPGFSLAVAEGLGIEPSRE